MPKQNRRLKETGLEGDSVANFINNNNASNTATQPLNNAANNRTRKKKISTSTVKEDGFENKTYRFRKSQIKKLKVIAAQHDMKIQEVLEKVLNLGIPSFEALLSESE